MAMISFSKLIVSPSAVVSCFLSTSASVTCTPVLYSMSGRSRHCQTLQGMQVPAENGAVSSDWKPSLTANFGKSAYWQIKGTGGGSHRASPCKTGMPWRNKGRAG